MTITEYINQNEEFKLMPFMTVYYTILKLVKDGVIKENTFDVV